MSGKHTEFIAAANALTFAVIGALVFLILSDYRAQLRLLDAAKDGDPLRGQADD